MGTRLGDSLVAMIIVVFLIGVNIFAVIYFNLNSVETLVLMAVSLVAYYILSVIILWIHRSKIIVGRRNGFRERRRRR